MLGGAQDQLLSSLPPLPPPHVNTQRMESAGGICFVLSTIAGVNVVSYSVVHSFNTLPPAVYSAFQMVMSFLSAVALFCLCGVQLADPGVVKRTVANCFPQPEAVAALLEAGGAASDLCNFKGTHHGMHMSFCVRCFVWRPGHGHHCNTCQRCVTHFDHHCGVLGRCIAGEGLRGNLNTFFHPLLCCAMAGIWSGIGFAIYAAVLWEIQRDKHQGAAPGNGSLNGTNATGLLMYSRTG